MKLIEYQGKDDHNRVLTEAEARSIREEPRFRGIEKFHNKKTEHASPAIYGGKMEYVKRAFEAGTSGENVEALEKELARFTGVKTAKAFDSGTAALHMAVRLAAAEIYGSSGGADCPSRGGSSGEENEIPEKNGFLSGRRVFCSDLTSSAMVNPVLYEGGEPVFIDASPRDWCMDPEALELGFEQYPDVKLVIMSHVYGFPGQIRRVKEICENHGALLIEDACESFGASIDGKQTGSFGDYGVLSFGSGQILTGAGGGMLLADDLSGLGKVQEGMLRSLQKTSGSRYEEAGYGSRKGSAAGGSIFGQMCNAGSVFGRMSDVTAGIILGQMRYLDRYIAKKKVIYERYEERFSEDMMLLNPIGKGTEPNYRTSCMTVESSIVFKETRSEREYEYVAQHGTAAPMEILDALEAFGIGGRPIWKPMHMQPIFQNCDQITLDGSRKSYENTPQDDFWVRCNESADIFRNGLCLPSDIRMTEEEQEKVIDIVFSCYNGRNVDRRLWYAI